MIREMWESDLEAVSKLMFEGHNYHKNNRPDIFKGNINDVKNYLISILKNDFAYKYVYEINNDIGGLMIGNIKIIPEDDLTKQRKIAFIEYIVIRENYQRKGIGTKLYKEFCSNLKKENIDAIELCVWAFNEKAIKFYESLGMSVKNMRFEMKL